MRWDPLLAAATAKALSEALTGGRTRGFLFDASARRAVLYLKDRTLVLELHPLRGWLSSLAATDPLPEARALSGRIQSLRTVPDESVLALRVRRSRGDDEEVEFVFELSGNGWNALLVGVESGTIRHALLPRAGGTRPQVAGARYTPPPSTGRLGAHAPPTASEWAELRSELRVSPQDAERILLSRLAWTSSLNVRILVGSELDSELPARWREMTNPDLWGAHLMATGRGVQPYPLPIGATPEGFPAMQPESLLSAFGTARSLDPSVEPAAALLLPSPVLDRARSRIESARSRGEALRRQLSEASGSEKERARGDLLLARFAEIPRGADSVRLTDFAGRTVEIRLDPALPPHENAARYYSRAGRMDRAREELPTRVEEALEEARLWEGLLEAVLSGRQPWQDLAERLGPDRGGRRVGSRPSMPAPPYRRFRSSGGLEIRVGRGAGKNDDLTFRNASPEDIWLHARQAAGAHVILRWGRPDENPPRRDLLEAATLAALHSGARHSGSVPVDWTRRKHVRKPRKAPPGSVVPERVQTVFVEPDPDLAERLRPDPGPWPP